MIARDRATTNEDIVDSENIFNFIVMKYISLIFDNYGPLERPNRLVWLIVNCNPTFCEQFLRFRKPEIHGLYTLMRFENYIILDNRSTMSCLYEDYMN